MKKTFNLLGSFLLAVFLFSNVSAQKITTSTAKPRTPASGVAGDPVKTSGKTTTQDVEKDVAEALSLIEDNHTEGNKLNYNDLFKSSIDSMLHTLDPHSNYFDAKEFEDFRTNQSSQYFGIGALLGDLSDKDGKVIATYIRATFDGAPANRAGLRFGDKILDVNGTSMIGKNFTQVRNFLIGPRGTTAKITVEHYGGKTETVNLVRDAVSQPSIAEAYMVRPGVGYIAMTGGFHQTTYNEFRVAMADLKAQGMQQLVLDLRNNPGGLVSQAYQVANTFLPQGQTILTQRGRIEGAASSLQSENPTPDNTPIVVLINRNSASASEILAGALQDHDRALIVGENSYGKGLVQNPFPLEYGSMLLLTIAKYETPSGRLVQRDYSDGNLYNYLYDGGSLRDENKPEKPKGAESRTDSGRIVYSGGGINPDEPIKAQTISIEKARFQQKLNNPIFAFTLDLAFGRVKGFENYKVDRAIAFNYDLKANDFPINDTLYQTFKNYAVEKYGFTAAQVDREREFVQRVLRTELVTAAYGSQTSFQVFNEYDTQLKKAIELLPQAKQLAIQGAKANALKTNKEINR